jgi:hypothetical protein
MIARLANALYWIFSSLAAIALLLAVWGAWGELNREHPSAIEWVAPGILALLLWLVGRLLHYVLHD